MNQHSPRIRVAPSHVALSGAVDLTISGRDPFDAQKNEQQIERFGMPCVPSPPESIGRVPFPLIEYHQRSADALDRVVVGDIQLPSSAYSPKQRE